MFKKLSQLESTRVVIIGAGNVGATCAYAIMIQGIASEIVIIDVNKKKCEGECLDLEHGLSFVPQTKIWAGEYKDCKNADVVVITAGLKQKPGQTRLELTATNSKIIAEIAKNIRKQTKQAIILVVTNPLDVMTYVALKSSKLPANQVFGTGTTLDSARYRYLLAQHFKVAADSMGAYLVGEHGDSSVPVLSHANLMGESVTELRGFNKKSADLIAKKTKKAAYDVINKKGATFYAIALAVSRIVRAILYNENHTFPVSVLLTGQYKIKDVCLSLPAVVGRNGIKEVIDIKLDTAEVRQLKKSASVIKKTINSI